MASNVSTMAWRRAPVHVVDEDHDGVDVLTQCVGELLELNVEVRDRLERALVSRGIWVGPEAPSDFGRLSDGLCLLR